LVYKVTATWWPSGWEPGSPLDVPNCAFKADDELGQEGTTYRRALATVRALNRQALDHAGSKWYVVVAVENEPISRTVSCDPSGTETSVEVRPMHVVRPEEGGSRGDCAYCPAHGLQCSGEDTLAVEQTITDTRVRAVRSRDE
jgi:hypothetical protein